MKNQVKWLKIAFMAGIITDALVIIPMLYAPMAKQVWGLDQLNGTYFYAMGYGAALMAGWTILLIWAYRKPLERRFLALLTVVVIVGLIIAEIAAVANGTILISKMVRTWILQSVLIGLFGFAYAITHQITKENEAVL